MPQPNPIMATRPKTPQEHIQYHKDGSVWARGQTLGDLPTGYWEWFRVDGTRLRSGHFEGGVQVGEWTTYDKKGQPYKVTPMKPKTGKPPQASRKRVPRAHTRKP